MIEPGATAPDFTLRDHGGKKVSLSDLTDQKLVLAFYPKGEMSSAYGAYLPDWGTTNRSLVLVGEDGVVRWSHAEETPVTIPGANLIFDALDK